jgi:hypothetical protein
MPSFTSQEHFTRHGQKFESMATTTAPGSVSDALSSPTTAVSTSSSSHTMCATNTALAQTSSTSDRVMNTKLLMPIIVATFLLAATLTCLLAYFLISRRRRRFQQPLNLSGTSQTPFKEGRWDGGSFSPVSPNDVGNNRVVFVGAAPVHEVDSGQRTPMEVLGDTTWAKGKWNKDMEIKHVPTMSPREQRTARV